MIFKALAELVFTVGFGLLNKNIYDDAKVAFSGKRVLVVRSADIPAYIENEDHAAQLNGLRKSLVQQLGDPCL